MRAFPIIGVLLSGVLGSGVALAKDVSVSVRPEFGVQAGLETFELSLTQQQPTASQTIDVTASSRLSYPVETVVAGGTARLDAGVFSASVSALTNVVDPWGTMLDQDWLAVSANGASQKIEFSHTESRTTLRSLMLDGALRLRVAEYGQDRQMPLYLSAGLRYESSAYEVFGADGWQLDQNLNKVYFSLPDDILGVKYDVQHYMPFFGVGVGTRAGERFVFDGEARFLAAFSSHHDDHAFRHKEARANSQGLGFSVSAEPGIDLGGGFVLGVRGELLYVGSVAGKLSQHYYADDPSSPGNEVGTSIPDADFAFTMFRARLLAFFAFRF